MMELISERFTRIVKAIRLLTKNVESPHKKLQLIYENF
jgi:hypothetical protein